MCESLSMPRDAGNTVTWIGRGTQDFVVKLYTYTSMQ
jgi:hypothetical protein